MVIPVLPLNHLRPIHVVSAVLSVATAVWIAIYSKLHHPSPLAVAGSWAMYQGLCALSSQPVPGRTGDGNTARHILTATALAVLDMSHIGVNMAVGIAGAASETIVGNYDEKTFLALALLGSVYLAVLNGETSPWSSAGRIILVLVTGFRNRIVRILPGSGFTDPTRPTRIIMFEYLLTFLSTITVLGTTILQVKSTSTTYIFLGTTAGFIAMVLSFAIDRAYNTSPATRAENIAMSLLSVSETRVVP